MGSLTIGEVARRAGVRPTTIRYWESEKVLPEPRRAGGQRRYDETVLARLAVVRLAQAVGFSVADLRALVDGFDDQGVPPERWRLLAAARLTAVNALIDRAEAMKRQLEASLRCGCITLDSCELATGSRPDGDATPSCSDLASQPRRGREIGDRDAAGYGAGDRPPRP